MQLSDFLAVCEDLWPVTGAEEWDNPGLAVGSESQSISTVLLSVDVTQSVINEAMSLGAELVLSHHPLILRGLKTASLETYKGAILATAIRNEIALFSAHTNADIVSKGVSDHFASQLGLQDIAPLVATSSGEGHGRIGNLAAASTVGELVAKLGAILPATSRGISANVMAQKPVQRVAVCGGAGDAFIEAAYEAGADVYVTSDLRHHVAQEAPMALVDVSHWASESLWLEVAATQLKARCPEIKFVVSSVNTDPWLFTQGRTQ